MPSGLIIWTDNLELYYSFEFERDNKSFKK